MTKHVHRDQQTSTPSSTTTLANPAMAASSASNASGTTPAPTLTTAVLVEPKDVLTLAAGDHLADAVADICSYFTRRRAARAHAAEVANELTSTL